jgi:hypothetical protein
MDKNDKEKGSRLQIMQCFCLLHQRKRKKGGGGFRVAR